MRSVLTMFFRLLCLAIVVTAAFSVPTPQPAESDDGTRDILKRHIASLKSNGEHLSTEVPEVLRGANMTEENLYRWLTVAKVEVQVSDPAAEQVIKLPESNDGGCTGAECSGNSTRPRQQARKLLENCTFENIDLMYLTGNKEFTAVADNRPNWDTDQTAGLGVLPVCCRVQEVVGFKPHQSYDITWKISNALGSQAVSFRYAWVFSSDAQCQGGGPAIGHYFHKGGIHVKQVEVGWGYDFNVFGEVVGDPFNGNDDWRDPLAALNIKLKLEYSTVLQTSMKFCEMTILGNGKGRVVHCDQYPYSILRMLT